MTEDVTAAAVSADGTVIAFTAWGEGEPLVIIDVAGAGDRIRLVIRRVLALDAAVADGRPGDAAELFMTAAAGPPAEAVEGIRQSEFWPIMEAVAPTIAYDGRIMGTTMSGARLPRDRWAAVTVPRS